MATWLWLNLVLGAFFVLAIAGIPLWLVLKHPDARHRLEHEVEHAIRSVHVPVPRAEADHSRREARPVYARGGQARRPQPWTDSSS
jgi:hypothetical protein